MGFVERLRSTRRSARVLSPADFVAGRHIVPAIRNAGFNTDVSANRFHELSVHRRQPRVGLHQIERLEPLGDLIEERCSPIVALQRFPVLGLPGRGHLDIANAAPDTLTDRHAESLDALRRLDQIAIAPVVLGELHVVVEDELIDRSDHVQIALPGYVVRLENDDGLHGCLPLGSQALG